MPRGPLAVAGERRVESNDVTTALQLLERRENVIKRTVPIFPWRVVEQHSKAQFPTPANNDGADMAHADDAQGETIGGSDAVMPHPDNDGTEYPLRHGRGVAARSIANGDAMGGTIVEIDVVGADGRRANELHAAAIEQGGIAAGAGANDEGIGILDGITGDVAGFQIHHLGTRLNQPLDIRNMAIDDDLHMNSSWAIANARQATVKRRIST